MKRSNGFSFIELLVTIVILGIVALIAIPGFSRWLPNYRLRAATRDVFSNFQHARLTAIKRHRTCAVTFNQTIATTIYDYVVYVDNNGDLKFDDPGDEMLTTVSFSDRYEGVRLDTTKGGVMGLTLLIMIVPVPPLGFCQMDSPLRTTEALRVAVCISSILMAESVKWLCQRPAMLVSLSRGVDIDK